MDRVADYPENRQVNVPAMNRFARSGAPEEALCAWAGRLLSGAREPRDPPTDDVNQVSAFLRSHGIGPLLASALGAAGPESGWRPDDDLVKNAVAAEMARNSEFVSVLPTLQSGAVPPPIVFKGQALAYDTYPQPWLRPRTDIDILVKRDSVEFITDTLAASGYERSDAIDADLVLPQSSWHKQRFGVRHVWDVHWRISNRPALGDILSYPEIRASALETCVDHFAFLAPDRVTSLLIACLHLVGHHAGDLRLIWLYDIRLLLAAMSESEHERFRSKAASTPEAQAACHAALELTQEYVPEQRIDELRRTLDPGAGARWNTNRAYFTDLLKDAVAVGRGNRFRFLMQHGLPPAEYMVKRFRIRHRWQLPFWYAVRIGRAVPKLFKRR